MTDRLRIPPESGYGNTGRLAPDRRGMENRPDSCPDAPRSWRESPDTPVPWFHSGRDTSLKPESVQRTGFPVEREIPPAKEFVEKLKK